MWQECMNEVGGDCGLCPEWDYELNKCRVTIPDPLFPAGNTDAEQDEEKGD